MATKKPAKPETAPPAGKRRAAARRIPKKAMHPGIDPAPTPGKPAVGRDQ